MNEQVGVTQTNELDRKEKAKEFSQIAHKGQVRKGDGSPYFFHPLRVGQTLEMSGFPEDVVIAGYLHDVVEDTPFEMEDIETMFGNNVRQIVEGNTEDKSKTWQERKSHTIEELKTAPLEIKALVVADKLDNLKSLYNDFQTHGEEVWKLFKEGKQKQIWYFTEVRNHMKDGLKPNEYPGFFDEYDFLVTRFFDGK